MKNGKLSFDAKIISSVLVSICRFLTGIRAKQISPIEKDKPCIYYANHSSHLDGLVIWSSLAPHIRPFVHPVAAEDYWNKNPFTSLSFSSYLSCSFDPTSRE